MMMYLNEESENGFGTINESKAKKMTNWTNIFNHWKRKGKVDKNGVISSANVNLSMSQSHHPHQLHNPSQHQHHLQQQQQQQHYPHHHHGHNSTHQVYPIHQPYQFGSLAVRHNGSGLPGLIDQYNTSNIGGGGGGGVGVLTDARYQRPSGLQGRVNKFASVSAGTGANFYLAYPTGSSLLAPNQVNSSSPCSLNIRYPSSAPSTTLHSSIRPTSSSRHQRANILSTPWEPMISANSSANHNQSAECTCCESMGTDHQIGAEGAGPGVGGRCGGEISLLGKTTLKNIKKSATGSVRSRSSIKSSYCASNFDVVDETMSTGLSHVSSRLHHGTVNGKSMKSSSTRSHRTVSFATVNERFLKVLKRSVKNPSGSVVSRRSILECDLTAYDLVEQHETCIEDEDVIIEEEKENQSNHRHYANHSSEYLSEDEDDDMDDHHSRHHHRPPSMSASANGLHSISKHGHNLLPRLCESSLRGKSRGKSISTVDLSTSQRPVITDGKASLRKGLRIGGQGMSLFPSAVESSKSTTTSNSTNGGVIKSRSSESILSDKSSSIISSNLTDRPASCLLLPLPEPDYDSEAASGEEESKRGTGNRTSRNQFGPKSGPKLLRDAQSFTSLHQPQLNETPIKGGNLTSTPIARNVQNLGETRSLDRRAKRRGQLRQAISSSSLIGNSIDEKSVNCDNIKGSTPSIPSDNSNYMSKVKSILKKSVTWNESVTKTPSRSSPPSSLSSGNAANCDNTNGFTNNCDSDFINYNKCSSSSSIITNGLTTLPRIRGRWSSERSTNSINSANKLKGSKVKKHVHFGCSKDDDSLIIEHIGDNTIFEEDEEPIYDDIANIITTSDQSSNGHHQTPCQSPEKQPLTSRLPQSTSLPPPPPPPPLPTHSLVPLSPPTQLTPNSDYKGLISKSGNLQSADNQVNCLNINESTSSLKTYGTNDETKEMSTRRVYGILEIGDTLNSPRSTNSYLQLAPKSPDQLVSDSLTNGKKTVGSKVIKEQPALSSSTSSSSSNQLYKISRSGIINGLRRDVDSSSSQSSSSSSDEGLDLLSNGKQLNDSTNHFDDNNQVNHNRLINNDGPLSPEFTSSLTNHHQKQQQQQLTNYDERHSTLLSELRADIREKLENKLIKDIIISNELKSLAKKSTDCNRFNGIGNTTNWSANNNQRNLINSITNKINNNNKSEHLNRISENADLSNQHRHHHNHNNHSQSADCSETNEQNDFDAIDNEDNETIKSGKTDYGFTVSIVNNVNNNSNRNRNCDYSLTSTYSSNTSSSSYYDTNLPLEESSKIVINVPLGGGVGGVGFGTTFYDNETNEHIYEELDKVSIYESNRSENGNDINQLTKRSIFEGASRDEILEYLADAKERVVLIDENTSGSLANHHHHNHLHHLHHGLPTRPNLASTRRNRTSNVSNVSSSSTDSSNTATSSSIETEDCSLTNSTTGTPVERNDSGVGVETSKPLKIRRTNNLTGESEQTCADCEQLIEPKEINGTNNNHRNNINHLEDNNDQLIYYNIVCSKCEKKRSERKEIISEFVDTEFKYGRDLRIIREEFHRPMEVAGLLTKEQIKGVFINLEELISVNSKFSEKLQDAIDIASEQGDEDFTTVNIGRLFMESASMLHSFETYCLHQGSASVLLNQLEKEKELLRIFLRVSQMENTLLRRMNLSAFLMVPVQRVTKYPLLLNRLYKVTPHHHQDRDALKLAQQKVEIHLEHINQQTKGSTAPTKIWRKFSHLSNRRLPSIDDIGDIKLRKVALEAMSWTRDQANFILSGRLSFLPSSEYQLYKKRGNIKFSSASCLLMSLGEMLPTIKANLTEDDEDEFERELMFPRSNHGCEQAVIILIKEKHNRYTLCREPFNLASCVVSSDTEFEDIFEIHEQNTKESFIFKADSPTEKRDWYRQICYHSKNLGNWRKRRNALANIMMVRP